MLWRDMERKNAQDLITFLLKERKAEGWTMTLPMDIAFTELTSSSVNRNLEVAIAMRILRAMQEKGKSKVCDFEKAHDHLLSERQADQKALTTWHFYIPFELKVETGFKLKRSLQLLQRKFVFRKLQDIEREIRTGKLTARDVQIGLFRGHFNVVDKVPQVFLSTSCEGISWEAAWHKVVPAFDALRGLIEFVCGFGSWRLISTDQAPRRLVPHPKWMIVKKLSGEAEGVAFLLEPYSGSTTVFTLGQSKFNVIKGHARQLRGEPQSDSTRLLVVDALRLYSQAMDARFNYGCFLGLWQLAESIVLSRSFGGEAVKVADRITKVGMPSGLIASGWRHTLRRFAEKRNDVVHRGLHDIKEEEINILKLAVSFSLLWLLRQLNSLPTTVHLEQFYRLSETNEAQLCAMKHCINQLTRKRGRGRLKQKAPGGTAS